MAENNKFELPQSLESLVRNVNATRELVKQAERKPSRDDAETRNYFAEKFQDDRFLAIDAGPFVRELRGKEDESYRVLDSQLDNDTYEKAKAHYLKSLDDDIKDLYYVSLLEGEIRPETPSERLQEAIKTVNIAKLIDDALNKDNINAAKAVADKLLNNSQATSLTIDSLYSGEVFRGHERKILSDVAKAQKRIAGAIIKEAKLYSEIDNAVLSTEYGKAKSLSGLYNVNKLQEAINEAKKKNSKEN